MATTMKRPAGFDPHRREVEQHRALRARNLWISAAAVTGAIVGIAWAVWAGAGDSAGVPLGAVFGLVPGAIGGALLGRVAHHVPNLLVQAIAAVALGALFGLLCALASTQSLALRVGPAAGAVAGLITAVAVDVIAAGRGRQ